MHHNGCLLSVALLLSMGWGRNEAILFLPTPAQATESAFAADDSATHHVDFHDIEQWEESLENPDRAKWQMPDRVVDSLDVQPRAVIADIGAGTGYFNLLFAKAVGDSGKVYAEEIEPELVRYMFDRRRLEGTPQVMPILGSPEDPRLPDGLDLVFVCNTYRYIDGRRAYFARLLEKLEPAGRLAIIDFTPTPQTAETRISADQVREELEAVGYELAEVFTFLPVQYFLVFKSSGNGDHLALLAQESAMQATKPADNEILLTQTFSAPRETVFAALTKAEHLRAWMRPSAMTLVSCEVDLRVGGQLRHVFERPNGRKIEVRGKFEEVDPPRRFVYTETYDFSPLKVLVTTSLEETGDKTTFKRTLRYASQQERDEDFPGVATSSKEVYAKLEGYLAQLGP